MPTKSGKHYNSPKAEKAQGLKREGAIMSDKEEYDGAGFSRDPIEGEEAARHRHMFHVFSRDFLKVDPDVISNMKNASTLVEAGKVLNQIIKIGAGLGTAAFVVALFAKSQGWL